MAPPKIYTTEFIEREADLLDEWITKDDHLFFKEFAIQRGYAAKHMIDWSRENERFGESYARAKDWQELKLMSGGLNRKFDAQFTKFTMQNVCKWSDKQTVVHENNTQAIDPAANNTSKDLVNDKSN